MSDFLFSTSKMRLAETCARGRRLKSIRILVVEDDADLNQAVYKHLSRHSYQTIGKLDANQAFAAMEQ